MKITQRLRIMLKSMLDFEMGQIATDKAVLVFDGNELHEGMEVYVIGPDNEPVPAANGDYTVEDGKIIRVVDGKVAEILDPRAEVANQIEQEDQEPAPEPAAEPEAAPEGPADVQQEENPEVQPADSTEPQAEPQPEVDRLAAVEERLLNFTEGLNKIINSLAAMEDRFAAVEGKLAKVEEPAANPVDETPTVESTPKTKLSYLRKD